MFSWLFGSASRNKPSILMQQTCQHDLASTMMQLPNGLILSGGKIEKDNQIVNLELYDPINKTLVANRRLESRGHPRFLCMSKEWVLIKCEYSSYQYVVNSLTLQSDKKLEAELNTQKLDFYDGVYLGGQQFATLSEYSQDTYVIMIHDLSTMKFNQPASAILTFSKEASAGGHMLDFKKLPNGLFACRVKERNTSSFQVLLFKREPGATFEFTQIKALHPKTERSSSGSASGSFIGLSDGRILTYHSSGKHFQIWQTDGQCVDEWSFHKDVTCNDETFKRGLWINDVASLPDGKHLLIQVLGEKLFLFNMKTRLIKPVDFGKLELTPWDMEVCSNGQVAVRMTHKHKDTRLVYIDLKEMMAYRQEVTEQLYSVGLSPDVNRLVTSYISESSPWVVAEEKKPGKR